MLYWQRLKEMGPLNAFWLVWKIVFWGAFFFYLLVNPFLSG